MRLLTQSLGTSPTGHEQNVSKTFALSYEQLDSTTAVDRLAGQLLVQTACLSPGEPIPLTLVQRLVKASNGEAASSSDDQALQRLVALGLICQAADRFWPCLKAKYELNPADYYQVTNETGGDNPQSLANILAFERRLMELSEPDHIYLQRRCRSGHCSGR